MQDKKVKQSFVLLSVPAEMLWQAGIFEGGAMKIGVEENRIVIEKADTPKDFVCDGNCADCPCSEECEDSEV